MSKKIEEFLKKEYPEMYDFREECVTGTYNVRNCSNSIARYLCYKIESPPKFDTDGSGEGRKHICNLSREIYKYLFYWDENEKKRYSNVECMGGMKFGPDTMNTFLIKALPELLADSKILNDFKKIQSNQKFISVTMLYKVVVKGKLDINNYLTTDEMLIWSEMSNVISTIGNFTLVPKGFNTYRATSCDDYWDLSLQLLNQGTWAHAGLFNWYINYFFLWDYVSKKNSLYNVKMLYSKEFQNQTVESWEFEGVVKYQKHSKNDILIWMRNVCWAVKRRGLFMVAIMKMKQNNGEIYQEIYKLCFNTSKVFSGFDEVIDLISVKIKDKNIKEQWERDIKGLNLADV